MRCRPFECFEMCSSVKDFICDQIFRCVLCKNFCGDSSERCSPKVRLKRFTNNPESHELFSSEMGSNRLGEFHSKISCEDRVSITKRNGTDSPSRGSQTPEYVKRTAKLFEAVRISEKSKNGDFGEDRAEPAYLLSGEETRKAKSEAVRISLDCLDGEYYKMPSYVGVSCSNSGYRNVINYDSKLREGFWSANSQRESLVLSSSRLRESSPLRRDFDFKSQSKDAIKVADVRVDKPSTMPMNGVGRSEKFANVSTSTNTISTFRNSKDIGKEEQLENGVNGVAKVNLKQILNGKSSESYRKGYSNLGFSPKILKSPEKNCNSFLKSISSFENNCKKSQAGSSWTHSQTEQRVCDGSNSIQQRIERLYGPGALAQGFYTQKPHSKTNISGSDGSNESPLEGPREILPKIQPQVSVTNSIGNSSSSPKETPEEKTTTSEKPSHVNDPETEETEERERNGHYFLRLLKKETDRLEQLASFAESELENGENLPEEISGKLRAAAGKARLLVCQKLHQFEGLCHKNLNEKSEEEFPTTGEDLAGFWDMVMLQVVQVYGVFEEIEELKKNNWKSVQTKKESSSPATRGQSPSTRTTPKKSAPSSASSEKQNQKSESVKKAREEGRRKMLEERRKKMKELKENKIINSENEVEIFAK